MWRCVWFVAFFCCYNILKVIAACKSVPVTSWLWAVTMVSNTYITITSLFSSCVSIFAFTPPRHWIEGPEFGEVNWTKLKIKSRYFYIKWRRLQNKAKHKYNYSLHHFHLKYISLKIIFSFTISIIALSCNLTHFPGILQYKDIATNMDATHQNSIFRHKKIVFFWVLYRFTSGSHFKDEHFPIHPGLCMVYWFKIHIMSVFKDLSQYTILTVMTFLMALQRVETWLDPLAISLDHMDHLAFGQICCMTRNSSW